MNLSKQNSYRTFLFLSAALFVCITAPQQAKGEVLQDSKIILQKSMYDVLKQSDFKEFSAATTDVIDKDSELADKHLNDCLIITFDQGPSSIKSIEILDAYGKLFLTVLPQELFGTSIRINTTELTTKSFYVKINDWDQQFTFSKVVKKIG
jgi:hypothetical protein